MKHQKSEKINLTKEDFSFVCPLKTADMKAVDDGYFCGKCEKKVHDVSNFTNEEFLELSKKSDNLCITFKKVATVSLVLGLSACSSQTTGKISQNHQEPQNRLSPFPVVDKNQTIKVDRIEEPEIAGGKMAPIDIPCSAQVPKEEKNHSLSPFSAVDKNQTIKIDKVEEPEAITGDIYPVTVFERVITEEGSEKRE